MRRLKKELSEAVSDQLAVSSYQVNSYKLNKNIVRTLASRCGDLGVLQMFTHSGGSSG